MLIMVGNVIDVNDDDDDDYDVIDDDGCSTLHFPLTNVYTCNVFYLLHN